MIRKVIIVVLTLGAAGILLPAVASFWRPINLIYDGSKIGWLRISFSRGDMQLVAFAPNEQDRPMPHDRGYDWYLGFDLSSRGRRSGKLRMYTGIPCLPATSDHAAEHDYLPSGVRPKRDVKRLLGSALWRFRVRNTITSDWTDPRTLKFICRYVPQRGGHPVNVLAMVTPCWPLVILFGAYPALAFVRGPVWRWRRRKHGLCLKCGYDLRGSPGPRCPECGTEVPQP